MTLKYSGKNFLKVVWKADQQAWAPLHEEAFMAFGGSSVEHVVSGHLNRGVITADLRERKSSPVFASMLANYT